MLKDHELHWEEKEKYEIGSRILRLRDDQIIALIALVEIKFAEKDRESVIKEIKENQHDAIHLDTLLHEADSKKNLLWWVNYFEKHA